VGSFRKNLQNERCQEIIDIKIKKKIRERQNNKIPESVGYEWEKSSDFVKNREN